MLLKFIESRSGKTMAFFLSTCLILCQNFSPAFASSPSPEAQPQSISIPEEFGRIEESAVRAGRKTIIYIQDAHDSLEAQENISSMISHLVENHGVDTVYEEGYEGRVPTDNYFGIIKNPEVRERVSYFLLDKLRLGAAEYAHINRKKPFELIGADHIELHLKNIRLYSRTARDWEETGKQLASFQTELERVIHRTFDAPMKEWIRNAERYEKNEISLLDYIRRARGIYEDELPQEIFESRYPLLTLLLESGESRGTERTERIRALDFKLLFGELEALEEDFASSHLKNDEQRKGFRYSRDLRLLERLNRLKLTPAEYQVLKRRIRELKTEDIAAFMARHSGRSAVFHKKWEKSILSAIEFYEIARARDQRLEKRLSSFLEDAGRDTAVLVFGGFHKERIRSFLIRSGVSYLIIAPKISTFSPKHQEYYKRLMALGSHSFEIPAALRAGARTASSFILWKRDGSPARGLTQIRIMADAAAKAADEPYEILSARIESRLEALRKEILSARSEMRATSDVENPYQIESNVCRECDNEFNPAYNVFSDLDARRNKHQTMLLVGVGRGMSAIELALRYPKLEIWAVNKEADLWDDERIRQRMLEKGYEPEDIAEARSRIYVKAIDIESVQARHRAFSGRKFDLVLYEPRVQIYFEDKVQAISRLFNERVGEDGIFGFVVNSIFTSQEEYEKSDIDDGTFERNPQPDMMQLVMDSFAPVAEQTGRRKLGGNVYLKYHRLNNGKVTIPLRWERNIRKLTSTGLSLVWSFYERVKSAIAPEGFIDYTPQFEILTRDLLNVPPGTVNPAVLINGEPGSGKSTMAPEFQKHLEANGYHAVVVETDRFLKLRWITLRQVVLIALTAIPLIPRGVLEWLYETILVDKEKRDSFLRQVRAVGASQPEVDITISGHKPLRVRRGTVYIVEGIMAKIIFKDLSFHQKIYVRVDPKLQMERLYNRARVARGYSPLRAYIKASIWASGAFKKFFRSWLKDYDFLVDVERSGLPELSEMSPSPVPEALPGVPASTRSELRQAPVEKEIPQADRRKKLYLSMSTWWGIEWTEAQVARFAVSAIKAIEELAARENKEVKDLRIAVGYGATPKTRDNAERLIRVFSAYGIPVYYADELSSASILAEATSPKVPANERFDLAFHMVSYTGEVRGVPALHQGARMMRDGIRAPDSFVRRIAAAAEENSGEPAYRVYESLSDIPDELLKIVPVNAPHRGRLGLFDLGALKSGIPAFREAMKSKGYDVPENFIVYSTGNPMTYGMEELIDAMTGSVAGVLTDVDLDDAIVTGDLSEGGDPERKSKAQILPAGIASLPQGMIALASSKHGDRFAVRDVNGAEITPSELALIFAHYLHSRGERGPIFRTQPSWNALDRLARAIGENLVETEVGTPRLGTLGDPLVALNSSGNMFFKYKEAVFHDSAIAQALLTLEILLVTRRPLSEYLADIYKQIGPSAWGRTYINNETVLDGGRRAVTIPFPEFKQRHVALRSDVHKVGAAIAKALGLDPASARIETDTKDALGMKIKIYGPDGKDFWVITRNSTTENSVRIYAEAPTEPLRLRLVDVTQRTLLKMTGADSGGSRFELRQDFSIGTLDNKVAVFADAASLDAELVEELAVQASVRGEEAAVLVYNSAEGDGRERLKEILESFKLKNVKFSSLSFTEAVRKYENRTDLDLVHISEETSKALEEYEALNWEERPMYFFRGKTGSLGYGLKHLKAVKLKHQVDGISYVAGFYQVDPQAAQWMNLFYQAQFEAVFAQAA